MDEKYNRKTNVIQYTPKETPPNISELIDSSKYKELIDGIQKSTVADVEKAFLMNAATRHYKFNYSKIADYYASASAEMQDLMEKSALVIIDFENSIENGYTKLSARIRNIVEG